MTKLFGSLEAGGTKFVCAVGDENYNVIEKVQFPTTKPIETIDKSIEFFSKFEDQLISIQIQKLMASLRRLQNQIGPMLISLEPSVVL